MSLQMRHPKLVLTAGWLLAGACSAVFAHDGLDGRLARLDVAIAEQPLEAELFVGRAELHRLHEDPTRAWADLRQARRLAHDASRGALVEARLARDLGWWQAARRAASVHTQSHPFDAPGHQLHAEVLSHLGRSAEALAAYQRALSVELSPNPGLHLAAAATLSGRGEAGRLAALTLIEAGIQQLGNQVALVLEAVSLETALGRTDSALARLDTLARASGRPERWLSARGDVLWAVERFAEARVEYAAARDALKVGARRRSHTAAAERLQSHIVERLATGGEQPTEKR
jgi:predicted negative regulator of RcsB-dependent stress response